MRQPERNAGQGWSADVPATDGGGIDIRELTDEDLQRIGERLPLARAGGRGTYLVAWDGEEPVAHAHIAWARTKLGVPEIQDVFVREDRRRQELGTAVMRAAENAVAARGHERVSLSYGSDNAAAKRFYDKLGYRDAGVEPQRVQGTIEVRLGTIEVDETLLYVVKDL